MIRKNGVEQIDNWNTFEQCDQMLEKEARLVYIVDENVATEMFNLRSKVVSKLPKKSPNNWDTFVRNFVATAIRKWPNLVTLIVNKANIIIIRRNAAKDAF